MEEKDKRHLKRFFSAKQRAKCWEAAAVIPGRDPDRWRLDPMGNPVLRPLNSCFGPLCYEYDHIFPYSHGGKTSSRNCQILQTVVNRFKKDDPMDPDKLKDVCLRFSSDPKDFDVVESAVYGNVISHE
mmetsp:Transcript_5893/g.10491  ORF Transcript_5893/g.10491 Transcript_5893/m.10491 type:complete len:128 (-) Transcript_5893:571-954(-)|eukprot:CAMPEP_0204915422 /NCGR_PEP_ID=MMETSP1397-20131031/13424_1 /ASSEMBLY_ACC=CAM_ASM_000891 /TAXON_ID=49980 /ORGANISM="Climacostomum Climacostomum virens, Strain Stock W-24" /LENGTH=127 /DNA_ID=CAMNT_0052087457 /DNA_START=62 /DNA_END=445 /DNA_ORIENTATION=-